MQNIPEDERLFRAGSMPIWNSGLNTTEKVIMLSLLACSLDSGSDPITLVNLGRMVGLGRKAMWKHIAALEVKRALVVDRTSKPNRYDISAVYEGRLPPRGC